ncbi:MAG: redoxin domain-containing protein, partial [Erythrobacter cryptus]
MADTRPSYQIAAQAIRPYVQPLWPGALAMPFDTRDEQGRKIALADDHISGQHLIMAFLADPESEGAAALLRALAAMEAAFEAANATVLAISASSDATRNKAQKRTAGFGWPIIGDASGALFASYGLHKGTDRTARLVLVTPFRQIRTWFDIEGDASTALGTIMDILHTAQAAEETRWSPPHAPVLVVPN